MDAIFHLRGRFSWRCMLSARFDYSVVWIYRVVT